MPETPSEARAQDAIGAPATCFRTGGDTLEICRDGSEAEGVFHVPGPCAFARNVQILRLGTSDPPGPLQVVFQGETPLAARRGAEACESRRALDPTDGGAVRSGRSPEQLAAIMPPAEPRLWEALRPPRPRRGRGDEPAASEEGIGPRNPIAVAGRDWAGEEYYHVFLIATAGAEGQQRRVQIQARTYDFVRFDLRSRAPAGDAVVWTPFTVEGRNAAGPAAVLDEAGKPVAGNCVETGTETQGLSGSISVVGQVYHYLYTDAVPEDCRLPAAERRLALYLRTGRDLNAPRVWSAPRALIQGLPPGTVLRAAKAKGMERWVVSYACRRPANAPGGPVADICVQYTPDLSVEGLAALKLYADPVSAGRSPAYLGLRSGGDGSGRFDRSGHYWMTDRYGNLDTPAAFPGKSGFVTWLDRLAPRADGTAASSLYGRPVYWATWTVRAVTPR